MDQTANSMVGRSELLVVGTTALVRVFVGSYEWTIVGGGGFNVAAAASRVGTVTLVTVVGDDFGDRNGELLSKVTSRRYVMTASGRTCRFTFCFGSDFEGPPTIESNYGVGCGLTRHALACDYHDVDLHVSCRHPLDTGIVLAAALKDRPRRLSLDFIGSSIRQHLGAALPFSAQINTLFVNESEYAVARMALVERGFSGLIVVTDGARGARVLQGGDVVYVAQAVPVPRVVEPSGAGDALAGAFLATLSSGGTVSEALDIGVRFGSLAVSGAGLHRILACED